MSEKSLDEKFMNGKPNVFRILSRLIRYIFARYRTRVFFMLFFILVSAVIEIRIADFMGTLIEDYVMPLAGSENPDFTAAFRYIAVMGVVFAVGVVSAFFITRTGAVISQRTLTDLRRELFSHMQDMGISYFDTRPNGETMGLFTNDLDTLVDVVSQSIPQTFAMSVNIIFLFITMLCSSLVLSWFVIAYMIVVIFLTVVITRKSNFQFRTLQRLFGKFNGFIEESIYSQKVIKVFSHENETMADFEGYAERMRIAAQTANRYANTYMPLLANIGNILYVTLVGVGVAFMEADAFGITIGSLVTFLQLTRAFTGPFSQISQHLNSLVRGSAGADRIFRFLDERPESDSGNTSLVWGRLLPEGGFAELSQGQDGASAFWRRDFEKADSEYVPLLGDVRFFNVTFSYEKGHEVLKDVSFYARPGEKIALVGSTGAGKTTITNLINRFYDIDRGRIAIDGIDIADIRKKDLRRSMAVVLQDTHLFSGTIRENIRFGRLDATDAEVEAAAKFAHAYDFIMKSKDGFDTVISGTDCQLSEGQKQLVTIARAAVANPPVLVLDEATSSVDSASEKHVEQAMDNLMKGRTTFVIAHRLSTIRNASCIMVLEHGRIVERGSHEELVEKKGRYWKLYTGACELD